MSVAVTAIQDMEIIRERNRYLEEANFRYGAILDMLATSGGFQADLSRARTPEAIFIATLVQVSRLLPFQKKGCLAKQQDASFDLIACDPTASAAELTAEIDAKINDGTFAWALNRNQPIIATTICGEKTLLLHVLSTQSNVVGMFVGLLPGNQTVIDTTSLNALTIFLTNAAYALESNTLYDLLRDNMLNLEEKVRQRTLELKAACDAAEAANKAKSSFLATMSHELRTPLNSIIGFTDLILNREFGPLNEIQEEYLGYVLQSSRHLLDLIGDILDLSKIEADKMELAVSNVNVRFLFEKCLIMIKELAHKGKVGLREEFAPDVQANICADERKLKQIFFNLLSNAVKFTPEGGTVTISVQKWAGDILPSEGTGNLPTERPSPARGFLSVTVADTGIGLRQEDLERIFDSFVQVDNSDTRKYEGTGLGLSLTRKLVEMHGGVIWAESAGLGMGSVFRFILPVAGCAEV
jgi:signal transduction histidine kinase